DAKTFLAAGMTKLIVVEPQNKKLRRWDLTTLKEEAEAALPPGSGRIKGVAMGAASDGPLVLGGQGDLITFMNPLDFSIYPTDGDLRASVYENWQVRAAANGQLFCAHMENWSVLWNCRNEDIAESQMRGHFWHVPLPGADGRYLYSTMGVHNAAGETEEFAGGTEGYRLPAAHGAFFLV